MTAATIEIDPDSPGGEGLPHNVPRRPRSRGVGPLDTGPTMAIAAGFITSAAVMTFVGLLPGFVVLLVTGVFALLAIWQDQHKRGPIEKGVARARWWRTVHKGWDWYLPGSLTVFGTNLVPGTGAMSLLTEAEDLLGQRYALLTYPQTGHHVVNIKANPNGAALTDTVSVTKQADRFAEWLVGLGNQPDLVQAAITITVAPDAFPALQREITENMKADAPAISKQLLKECLDVYPQGGSSSQASISLTFKTPDEVDRKQFKLDSGVGAAREHLATRLADILTELPGTGSGPVALMDSDDVNEAVQCAYNPGQRQYYQEVRAQGGRLPVLSWDQAGPSGAKEHWGSYDHDGATSITWEVTGYTNRQVAPRAMKPALQEPPKGVHSIRVTWLYRPVSPARSGFIAEADHAAAEQRKNTSKKPSARVKADVTAADRTRHAEANGKGLINTAILITGTVLNDGEDEVATNKRRAISALRRVAPAARLNARVMHGSQASAFAQAEGHLGLVTDVHLTIPTAFRKAT